MAKNIYKDINYDSIEEVEFKQFLEDCLKYKLVEWEKYQPKTYELIPRKTYKKEKVFKTKPSIFEEKTLYHSHEYTPDWLIKPTNKFLELDHGLNVNDDGTILIDIKGQYNRHGGDRIFPIHQKLMFHLFNIHVNKIVPIKFFKKINLVADSIRWKKNRKTPELKKNFKGIDTFEDKYKP